MSRVISVIERVGLLLWEVPMGVRLRWCPDIRTSALGATESVEAYVCRYLGRKREVEVSISPPSSGRWHLVANVVCPVDGYLRGANPLSMFRSRVLRCPADGGEPLTLVLGRGEIGV